MASNVEERKQWWRLPSRLAGLFAFGVVMTFVSAWGAALIAPAPPLVMWKSPNAAGRLEWAWSKTHLGMTEMWVRRGLGTDPRADGPPAAAAVPGALELVKPKLYPEHWVGGMTTVDEVRTYAFGFPARSMRWWSDFPPATGMAPGALMTMDQPIDRHEGMEIAPGTAHRDAKMLPLGICWGGVAIDTVFWMVCLIFGIEFAARLRRRLRERRERARWLCPHCGYSREGLAAGAVCPECGERKAT